MKKSYFLITIIFCAVQLLAAQQMPLDFSDSAEDFTGFSGTSFSFDNDPQDNSNPVGRFQNSGDDLFEGSFLDLERPVDLQSDKIINLRVYPTDNSAHTILVKLERGTESDVEVPGSIPAGNQNRWVDISFNYGNAIVSGTNTTLNATGAYDRITIFIDANQRQSGTFLIDDIDDGSTPVDLNPIDEVYDTLVWSDEFNTAGSNNPINSSNWFHQTKLPAGGSWFNGEVQHYTDRTENSYVEDGFLHVVAKRENFRDQGVTKDFTSARLNSKFAFTYGRVDVRAKLPLGEGTWPAIWTLGKNINEDGGYWQPQFGEVNWPACGEIDIMEHGLGTTNHVSSALHSPSSFGNTQNFRSKTLVDVANNFYVYSMNWSPNQITFLIDDVPFYTYNPSDKNASTYPFTEDQYILLNVALGGFAGDVESSFQESAMVIDYVRVYQKATAGIGDNFKESVKIYPNPSDDIFNIQSSTPVDNITLYDVLGNQVLSKNSETSRLDVGALSAGVYLMKLTAGSQTATRKVVVK